MPACISGRLHTQYRMWTLKRHAGWDKGDEIVPANVKSQQVVMGACSTNERSPVDPANQMVRRYHLVEVALTYNSVFTLTPLCGDGDCHQTRQSNKKDFLI